MPNYCNNSTRFYHDDPKKIDALVQVLESKERLFNHLFPMPEEYLKTEAPNRNDTQRQELTEKYGFGDWYDWCCNNWGCKWDADVYGWEREDENTVSTSFDTAWCPPTELYDRLTAEGWHIDSTYIEEGCAFVGEYVDGTDNCYSYSDATSDTLHEYVPEHLDEEYGISENMRSWEEENDQWESGSNETI